MQQFLNNEKTEITNNQFLSIESFYNCKSSAAVRECVIAHGLTSIKCRPVFLSGPDVINICERLRIKDLHIKKLEISAIGLDKDMFSYLHKMSHLSLHFLHLNSPSNPRFVQLKTLSGLTHLSIDYIETPGLRLLFSSTRFFKSLKSLSIKAPFSDEKSFPPESSLDQLEHFTYMERLPDEFCSNYGVFDPNYRDPFFDKFLFEAKNLQSLALTSAHLDSTYITNLSGLEKLTTLDLSNCKAISDMAIPVILSVANLTTVTLTGTLFSRYGIDRLERAGKTVIFEPQ